MNSLCNLLLILTLLPAVAFATPSGAELDVRVFDSMSGAAVAVRSIELQSTNADTVIPVVTFTRKGQAHITLEAVEWIVTVSAENYRPLQSHIHASKTRSVDFFLDPIDPPEELATARIRSLQRPDATLISGFVVDDETGEPLAGVLVATNAGTAQTNDKGFFRQYILLATPKESAVAPNSILFSKPGYRRELRRGIEVWANGDWTYRIRLQRGSGESTIDESKLNAFEEQRDCEPCGGGQEQNLVSSVIIPSSIRVGRNCTGTSCTTVEVHSMDTYVKRVLPAEWYSCWGSLTNGMNSLQAGAVAIRSYGLWYVYHPISSTYDICDNTSCQAFGTATSTNANNAVDATPRYILTDAAQANVQRSEYSAENNNSGCGDGFTGTGTSWPCISDQTCLGQTRNGHGRGMCQWGSARWANGTRILTSSPCSQGTSHGLGTMTWQQILSHYYPSYTLTQGETATIQSAAPDPASVSQGSTFTINYAVNASAAFPVILAASIAPSGTTTYTSDPARDLKVTLAQGNNNVSRSFVVPTNQQTGVHDLLVAIWYDKNNNNIIDAGDFVIHSQSLSNALTITVLPVQLASFTARRINTNDVRLDWRTLSEINNYGFFVQRRGEGEQRFTDRPNAFVPGNGTTNEPHDYAFVDSSVPAGRWLYRLRQMDFDSAVHFSDPIEIQIPTGVAELNPEHFELFQNYPNPFNPVTNFQFSIDRHRLTTLKIFDLLGQEVATVVNKPLAAGVYTFSWDARGLPSGVYTYRLTSGELSTAKRFVLLR